MKKKVILGNLPEDMIVLIHGLMEAQNSDNSEWIVNNLKAFEAMEVETKTLSVKSCWDVVKEWDICFDRGQPHIEAMCKAIKEGFEFPPIVHYMEDYPLDGRHRITAFRSLRLSTIESIDLDDLGLKIERMRGVNVDKNQNLESITDPDDLVDDLDPQEKLAADLAGVKDPDTRALIILRNTLDLATDVLNGSELPVSLLPSASSLLRRVETCLADGEEKSVVLKDASDEISEWLKEEELDEVGQELLAVKKIVDRAPALEKRNVIGQSLAP